MDDRTITLPSESKAEYDSFSKLPTSNRRMNFPCRLEYESDCVSVEREDFMISQQTSPCRSSPMGSMSLTNPAEDESIALARALMAQEAIQSYTMSADYLRYNQGEYSQEDLAALQAVINEEDGSLDTSQEDQYEMMLRLGEAIGDVRQERWTAVAKTHIASLERYNFVDRDVRTLDENDSRCKCLICQFNYKENEVLRKLPCGHCFHEDCVDQWLNHKDCCPYCRKPIVNK